MDFKRFDGMTVETAINVIKQKHYRDLDATDFAFLKAREDYLSEADKAIYLQGENPAEVLVETTPLTREERIINENRPLQEQEHIIRDARNKAAELELNATKPLEGEARTEAQEKIVEERAEKAKELEKEVKTLEKEAERVEKEKAAEQKKADKEAEKKETKEAGK